jgi:adenine-specific DNA-methyltransferase
VRTQGDIRLGFVYERAPHITLKSIADNAKIDVIWARLQPHVDAACAELNAALRGHSELFAVESGGRAGTTIDFRATGAVKLPSGAPAPAGGFMKWEVPREPGTPWPEDHQRLWAKAHAVSKDASRKNQIEAEHALAEFNHLRGAKFTFETLPAQPLTPWLKEAEEDRITFTALTGWPGDLICAEGRFRESDKERRAGIFIDPEFDTVARADLAAAARGGGGSMG